MQRIKHSAKIFMLGCITGIISGGAVSLFIVCAKIVMHFSFDVYSAAENSALAAVCAVILVILCCLIVSVLQTLYPHSRGSGIPLAEASARGMLTMPSRKWAGAAGSLLAGSLLAFLSGVAVGGEGPSIGAGGLIGEGVGEISRSSAEVKRQLITGGSSAGLAAAFNAPLTGVAFALEETHRRFSPSILLAALSAVIPAVAISQLIFWGLGHNAYLAALGVRAGAVAFPALSQIGYTGAGALFAVCGVAIPCGIFCALAAAAFNRAIFALASALSGIRNGVLRLLPAFIIAATCGIAFKYTIGCGDYALEKASESAVWLIITLLAVRFVMTVAASGCGTTGGLMLPILTLGGLIGLLAARACVKCGLDPAYSPNIVFLCISAFFASSVRAPISAVIMSVELTASFVNLLPVTVAVAVATAAMSITRSEPLYERMMLALRDGTQSKPCTDSLTVIGAISSDSALCGRLIRDVLLPYNSLITELERGGVCIVPESETELIAGDRLTVRAKNVDTDSFLAQINDYITVSCKRNE